MLDRRHIVAGFPPLWPIKPNELVYAKKLYIPINNDSLAITHFDGLVLVMAA